MVILIVKKLPLGDFYNILLLLERNQKKFEGDSMLKILKSAFFFNKDSVYSSQEFKDFCESIKGYKKEKFYYEMSKAKAAFYSHDKSLDIQSSVILAGAVAYLFTLQATSEPYNNFLTFTLIVLFISRSEIYFVLPRLQMKTDAFDYIEKTKWTK